MPLFQYLFHNFAVFFFCISFIIILSHTLSFDTAHIHILAVIEATTVQFAGQEIDISSLPSLP